MTTTKIMQVFSKIKQLRMKIQGKDEGKKNSQRDKHSEKIIKSIQIQVQLTNSQHLTFSPFIVFYCRSSPKKFSHKKFYRTSGKKEVTGLRKRTLRTRGCFGP